MSFTNTHKKKSKEVNYGELRGQRMRPPPQPTIRKFPVQKGSTT